VDDLALVDRENDLGEGRDVLSRIGSKGRRGRHALGADYGDKDAALKLSTGLRFGAPDCLGITTMRKGR